jgi:two-component system, NtrC family, sensor kinase
MLPVLTVASDRCRRCYSCVRGCPAKAIRVHEGHAEIISERCVACGSCVRLCSQKVKKIVDNLPAVETILREPDPVVMIAPSFAAAFLDARPGQIIAALRLCGFAGVYEVAFGADLVGKVCQRLYNEDPVRLLITTPCPAGILYIEKFGVNLLPYLAPVLSPMAAMGKALKSRIRPGCHVVFAGPCTAKIREIQEPDVSPWVDTAMTFEEVEQLISQRGIDAKELDDDEFDPPHSYLGGVFPLGGGLAKVANLPTDITQNSVHEVSGHSEFTDLIARLSKRVRDQDFDVLKTRFFDALFCQGCIDGPVMPQRESNLRRKERIVEYLRSRRPVSRATWKSVIAGMQDLDLSRTFHPDPQLPVDPSEEEIRQVLIRTNKLTEEQELNCGACGYRSCREKAIAVCNGIAEVEMCLPYMIEKLQVTISSLHQSYEQLADAHTQLVRSERLASMGQMAAGIAHEVNNPLGAVLIYAHLLREHPELSEESRSDIDTLIQEAIRCKTIVGGLLDFARQTKVTLVPVDLGEMLEKAAETTRIQARNLPVTIVVSASPNLPSAMVDRDQMLQVFLNLMRNSVEAMPKGGTVAASAGWKESTREFVISVRDEGLGMPKELVEHIFNPFFSTKAVGKGTGLGLSICYGIVKMHRGQIRAKNNTDGPGATFEIILPANEITGDQAL